MTQSCFVIAFGPLLKKKLLLSYLSCTQHEKFCTEEPFFCHKRTRPSPSQTNKRLLMEHRSYVPYLLACKHSRKLCFYCCDGKIEFTYLGEVDRRSRWPIAWGFVLHCTKKKMNLASSYWRHARRNLWKRGLAFARPLPKNLLIWNFATSP